MAADGEPIKLPTDLAVRPTNFASWVIILYSTVSNNR